MSLLCSKYLLLVYEGKPQARAPRALLNAACNPVPSSARLPHYARPQTLCHPWGITLLPRHGVLACTEQLGGGSSLWTARKEFGVTGIGAVCL